jgi:hypothetical protein
VSRLASPIFAQSDQVFIFTITLTIYLLVCFLNSQLFEGLYEELKDQKQKRELLGQNWESIPTAESLFDVNHFRADPRPLFSALHRIFLSKQLQPTKTHYFIKLLEEKKQTSK